MTRRTLWRALLLAMPLFFAGCMVGPKYKRPAVSVPDAYRGAGPQQSPAASLGEERWWNLFRDPVLGQMIHTALAQNYDARIAATRVLEAQARVRITRSNEFPSAAFGSNLHSERNPKVSRVFPSYEVNAGEIDLSVLWNLDFWGRYRHQTEQARAQLLATEWGRRAVLSSLVANVATGYFQLRALDDELAIARQTLAARQHSLRLIQLLARHGSASDLEVSEAQQLVYTASAAIPDLEKRIQQQENLLSLLLGENPAPAPRGRPLAAQSLPASVPAGLPAQLLERRPDIREAEARLVAANAQIGVLKAALLPSISLTGTGGMESNALNQFLSSSSQTWYGAVDLMQPVFEGGALRAGVKLSREQWREMVLSYQQTVERALGQVSDALIAYGKDREFRRRQEKLTAAAKRSDELSEVLYRNGGGSYLQVLTAKTNYFASQLNLVQAQRNERLALVELYQALGGGWQQRP